LISLLDFLLAYCSRTAKSEIDIQIERFICVRSAPTKVFAIGRLCWNRQEACIFKACRFNKAVCFFSHAIQSASGESNAAHSHQSTVTWIEVLGLATADQLVEPPLWELHHQFAFHSHSTNLPFTFTTALELNFPAAVDLLVPTKSRKN
jgi:hypothetical protein